jgi:hypothetical protein
MSEKVLVVERPNEGPREYLWTQDSKRMFDLDAQDVAALEDGKVVWVGDIALTLEEPAEA